jgi:DNA mismatch repair protein MutS2
VLEWEALTDLLSGFAATPWGAHELRRLQPRNDPAFYRSALADVDELLRLIEAGDSLPLRSVAQIEPHLDEAAVRGAHLDGERLLEVADFFAMVENLAGVAGRHQAQAPRLADRLSALTPAPEFRKAVEKSFLPDGTLTDGASPRLKELRRRIQKLQSNILERLQRQAATLGGDSVVTMREGRYVISVTEHERAKVQGIVHDRSQSGTTYFVEPVAMLEIGNELRAAEADLRDEIVRILTELTLALRALVGSARANIDLVREIDVGWGKARWAARYRAHLPRAVDEPALTLTGARHPLLLAQKLNQATADEAFGAVVPITLSLTDGCRAVIISGPNTGGKTVALKTAGLAVLMIQAGMPIVADPESAVGVFDAVFADIGDEQSLALSLSTFSAHLKQVGASCRSATPWSLVLLDELGVGTDPEEGSALAAAVILTLVERGTKLVVTTHYSVLKTLSERDRRIQNAAFLFDEARLAPTYQLVLGRPGASYALQIARRLDFPDDVVTSAEAGVGHQARELAALLTRLSEEERAVRQARSERELEAARLSAVLEYNRGEEEKWRRLERMAEREIAQRVEAVVAQARRETEQLILEIRRGGASPDAIRRAHEAFAKLQQQHQVQPDGPGGDTGTLRIGQKVRIAGIRQTAEVTQLLQDGERVQVQIGSMHYTVDRGAVAEVLPDELPGTTPKSPPGAAVPAAGEPSSAGLLEIDLRGRAADEAVLELEDLLEAADRQGYRQLRVIHGRGTGVLRREVSRWLKKHPRVKSARLGGRGEGGDGVTVVELSPP